MKFREALGLLFPRKSRYDLDRAVVIVYRDLPAPVRATLDHGDIETMLRLIFHFREERGLGFSREGRPAAHIPAGDLDAAVAYIQRKAELRGKTFADADIRAVIAGEDAFMVAERLIEA